MANVARAEVLVETLDRDDAFRAAVEAAPTVVAKRAVLAALGFGDVTLADMQTYVEYQGGTLTVRQEEGELTDQELASVAGGVAVDGEVTLAFGPTSAVMIGVGPVVVAAAAI